MVEVIYRPGSIPGKRHKKLKKNVSKESDIFKTEERQKKISERKNLKAKKKKIKKRRESKLRKLIQAEVSAAIEEVINAVESIMPEKIVKSWLREKQPAEEKWLRMKIKEWMRKNDCEEISDLKCSPETISALVLLRSRLKQSFSLQSIKYQNTQAKQKANDSAFREEQLKKFRKRKRLDPLKIVRTISRINEFADKLENNHGYD